MRLFLNAQHHGVLRGLSLGLSLAHPTVQFSTVDCVSLELLPGIMDVPVAVVAHLSCPKVNSV
jgi:hypothetical protein